MTGRVQVVPARARVTSRTTPLVHVTALPGLTAASRLAAVALVLVGADLRLPLGLSAGLLVAVALLPVWLGAVRRYSGATTVLVLLVGTLLSGLWLAQLAAVDHEVDPLKARQAVLLMITAFGGLGVLLWARQVLPFHLVAALYGAGSLVSSLLKVPGSSNSWKYELAFPVTVIVLATVGRLRSFSVTIGALTALGVIGITQEYRSYFGFCLMAAVLGFHEARPRVERRRVSRLSIVTLIVGLAASLYYIGTAALVDGYLGKTLQERSSTQVAQSGSLVVGGRPEWAATVRLMQHRPTGFGLGVVPLDKDTQLGRAGLADVGVPVDPNRDAYMFGGQFRLHAIIADLWVSFGIPGLALGFLLLGLLLLRLVTALAQHRASALLVFLTLIASWDLLFGPIYTNLQDVTLAVGLTLLAPSRTTPPKDDSEPADQGAPALPAPDAAASLSVAEERVRSRKS